jgi:Na+/melibiose symporter-like transporter
MTTTTSPTAITTAADERTALGPIWRTGAVAGIVAAGATTVVASTARAADIGLRTVQDEPIPLAGFPQVTIMAVLVGLALASVLARRARHPRTTFTRATVALTALSCVPSVLIISGAASIAVSILTHLVAAAIVIPAVRDRLPR